MEISTIGRPRNVGWARAAALLYGDWGTSKAYTIGLAMGLLGFAALPHLMAVCLVTGVVGINYIWICKYFPSGGGVYASAGLHSRRLAVIGGLLLFADFVVTASLSCLDAFHYLGFEGAAAKKWAIVAIFATGAVNYFGPKHTGSIALWLAAPVVLTVVALIGGGMAHLGEFKAAPPTGPLLTNWVAFVGMILALSGVEAAATNTGVMRLDPGSTPERPSVHRTARLSVLVVMIEVVLGTALLSVLAMCLPAEATQHREDLLRYMGDIFIGARFGQVVGWVFALLLLSAVNTAICGMVSLLYVLARDRELPEPFTQLNQFGVPWLALMFATIIPVIVLDVNDSVEGLAALYAIGVVGAITIDLGSCSWAPPIKMASYERWLMRSTAVLMLLIWVTIATTKLNAALYVAVILGLGLALREYTQRLFRKRAAAVAAAPAAFPATALAAAPAASAPSSLMGGRMLVAARGDTPALQYALETARLTQSQLLVLYVREVAVMAEHSSTWQQDPHARRLFEKVMADSHGVQINPLYGISDSPADTIVDIAATFGVDTVILGGSRRAALVNLLKGNVVTKVASHLPDTIRLIVIG